MRIVQRSIVALAASGIVLFGGGAAMAAPAHPQPAAVTAQAQTQRLEYTFDHETTVTLYNLVIDGSVNGATALCSALLPAPYNSVACPVLSSSLKGLAAMGAPGPNDRLHVAVQLGWPPMTIEYVR